MFLKGILLQPLHLEVRGVLGQLNKNKKNDNVYFALYDHLLCKCANGKNKKECVYYNYLLSSKHTLLKLILDRKNILPFTRMNEYFYISLKVL